jgi:DNA-binding NarL/FixJ family response regulator
MPTGRILLVDDDRLNALDLHQRVTQMGHNVLAIAVSGEEALAQAAALRPDVVLMDIRLPGRVDGIQAGTQIWAQFGIPVIYMSEHLTARTLQPLWPRCMAGLLGKHVGVHDLRRALEEVLETHSQTPSTPVGWRRSAPHPPQGHATPLPHQNRR